MEHRDYSKFFTLPETAKLMAQLLRPNPRDRVLEPSAGDGALVKAIKDFCYKTHVFAVEINPKYKKVLMDIADDVIIRDFIQCRFADSCFDSCIANPPFGNGIDLQAHFDKMRQAVKPGGRILCIVPEDFDPQVKGVSYKLNNWGTNKDGSVTPIKIIDVLNPK